MKEFFFCIALLVIRYQINIVKNNRVLKCVPRFTPCGIIVVKSFDSNPSPAGYNYIDIP